MRRTTIDMYTDYKFTRIRRDSGRTTAYVSFYEGEYKDIVVYEGEKTPSSYIVNRYVRTKKIKDGIYEFAQDISDKTMRDTIDLELSKDTQRLPIAEQRVIKASAVNLL